MATDPSRDALVQAALDFQKLSAESFFAQRKREDDDLEFQVPEKQWPENVQVMRSGQSVQGVPLPPRQRRSRRGTRCGSSLRPSSPIFCRPARRWM